jgi:hypothetical protein
MPGLGTGSVCRPPEVKLIDNDDRYVPTGPGGRSEPGFEKCPLNGRIELGMHAPEDFDT